MTRPFKPLLLLFILLITFRAIAQEDTILPPTENMEEEEIVQVYQKPVVRKMSADSIQLLKNQEAYGYMRYMDSLLRNKKKQIPKESSSGSLFPENSALPLQRLLLLSCIIIVGLVVWHFASGKHWLFRRNIQAATLGNPLTENNGTLPDFASLAEKARQAGDYRLAIRYFYLHGLQALAAQERIVLAAEKTNEAYRREMKSDNDYAAFAKFTQWYERAWFGHYTLAESQYTAIHQSFNQILKNRNN